VKKSLNERKLFDTCLYRTHGYSTEEVRCTHLSIGWSYLYLSMGYKYFKYLNLIFYFSRATTRAGFDSQLTLGCLGLLFRGKGLLAVEVRPIQSNLCIFSLNKKTRVLVRACIVANKGAKCPIFEGNMLPQKITPFFCPVNGAIA
jgi:hypothetical protein